MKKKILITGGSGFVGYNLILRLVNKHNLIIVVRKKNKKLTHLIKKKKIKLIIYKSPSQINNQLKKIKVDTVIHCATHYCKFHKFSDIKKMNDSNIVLGNIILENYNKIKFDKFINFTTVWESYNGIKGKPANLYAAYKQSFSKILNYYDLLFKKTKFYNLFLSETFGKNDNRKKIISVLKNNYKNNKVSKIISKNLYLNLLNVEDITAAIEVILNNKVKAGEYVLKNRVFTKISDLIKLIEKKKSNKIKIVWQSTEVIKEKLYKYKNLPYWKPSKSNLKDLVKFITN